MRGSREISLVPSLHRASTDALIILSMFLLDYVPNYKVWHVNDGNWAV